MIFMASILGCQNISNNKPLGTDRIIPDKTPFITGIIEASNDTVFYYPQVTVGYATDAQFATPYFNVHHIPGLFSPTQWTQVVRTIERFELSYEFEDEAEVWIKGPLSHKNEKGFFLLVEGGRIDHGHHAGNAYRALTDTIELSNAVAKAVSLVDLKETLRPLYAPNPNLSPNK